MDSKALSRMDMGFCIEIICDYIMSPTKVLVVESMSLGLTSNGQNSLKEEYLGIAWDPS